MPAQLGRAVYVLTRFDTGNVWDDDADLDDLRYGGALGIGANTAFGPLYLAYGRADQQLQPRLLLPRHSIHQPFLGRTRTRPARVVPPLQVAYFRVNRVLVHFVAEDALGGLQVAGGGGHVAARWIQRVHNEVALEGVHAFLQGCRW